MNSAVVVGDCSRWIDFGMHKLVFRVPTGSLLVQVDDEKRFHLLNVEILLRYYFEKYYFEVCVVIRTGYIVSVAALSCCPFQVRLSGGYHFSQCSITYRSSMHIGNEG